jgi:hypothetical protein
MASKSINIFQPVSANLYSTSRGGDGLVFYNMALCDDIYKFYYEEEEWISICKKIVHANAFKGPIRLKMGGVFDQRAVSNDEQNKFKDFVQEALDYEKMFGFCPVKITKSKGKKVPTIPSYGTGKFAHRTNRSTFREEIIFIPNDEKVNEKDFFVFVWPNRFPSKQSINVQSDIYKLFKRYLVYESFEEDSLDASFGASHPPYIFRKDDKRNDLEKLTEEDIYGMDDAMGDETTIDSKQLYKRSVADSIILENQLQNYRELYADKKRRKLDNVSKRAKTVDRATNLEDKFAYVGEFQLAGQVSVTGPNDLLNNRIHYEELVCATMGLSRNYIDRVKGGYKSDASNEQHFLKTTIQDTRENASLFIKAVYKELYKDEDDDFLVTFFMRMDEFITKVESGEIKESDGNEVKSLKKLKDDVEKIMKQENRIEVIFEEDPFSYMTPLEDIIAISDRKAISTVEEINLLRMKLSMNTVDESDPLVKEAEVLRKKREKLMFEPKGPEGKAPKPKPKKTES